MRRGIKLANLALVLTLASTCVSALQAQPSWHIPRSGPPSSPYDGSSMCRTVQICSRSTDSTYSTTLILDAFRGLISQLQLSPITRYVKIQQRQSCNGISCCCSAPIEVEISMPLDTAAGEAADLMNLATLTDYVRNELPQKLPDVSCISELQECDQPINRERRRLLSETPEVTFNTAVLPLPDLPTGFDPDVKAVFESAVVAAPVPADSSSSSSSDYVLPLLGTYSDDALSLGSYGSYQQQQAAASDHLINNVDQRPGRSLLSSSVTHHIIGSETRGCYCRYDSFSGTWDLQDAACRAGLYSRCAAGSLLTCAQVDAYYSAPGASAIAADQQDLISAFLFVDCPPAPPCACLAGVRQNRRASGSADSAGVAANHAVCCAELMAHCQTPFSGLDCTDVAEYCSGPGNGEADLTDMILSYVAVKTHNKHCGVPRSSTRSYAAIWGDSTLSRSSVSATTRQRDAGGRWLGAGGRDAAWRRSNLSTALLLIMTLMGSCLAAAVVVSGVIALVQQYAFRRCTTPLPGDWTAY